MDTRKKILSAKNATAKGPYSPAVEAGGLIFISGQLPIDPATGEIIREIAPATRQVMNTLQALLEDNGLSLRHLVKTTIFLQNMADFAKVNEIYAGFFDGEPPARSTIGVAALPKDAPIEIEAVAVRE